MLISDTLSESHTRLEAVVENYRLGRTQIVIVRGDITEQAVEAVVNAANSTLMGGGGVDGAIHRRGGPKILEECKQIRSTLYPQGLPTGKAVITTGGNLKASHVIHTVGPIWHGGERDEPELLKDCYINSMMIAVENQVKSIAFPSISTGAYGYPVEKASREALSAVKEFLEVNDAFYEVVFVLFNEYDYDLYRNTGEEVFSTQ